MLAQQVLWMLMNSLPTHHDHFLGLLNSHQRALHKICWVYGTHTHDRDDLLQEILAHLWSAFPRYDASRHFLTWMYRIALNVAIDHLRRNKRRGKEQSLHQHDGDKFGNHSTGISKQQELLDLHYLLQQQSDADRALLLLHLEGQSHREIGDILGITESNVSTRLNRLKQSLKQTILNDEQESHHATQ